ncbi:MAG TPA: DUF6691 family protein [bacterium]|jgi:uncharacterized membrane protein YedE/YeeE|nr:DUF6691 family protein [bacterium]
MKLRNHIPYLFWGLGFGFIISRAGATRFDYIRDMFLLRSPQLYFVIGGAIAVALPLFAWLHARGPKSLPWPHRRLTPGTLPGAAIFGVGWAVTGTCPGPAAVQVGEGHFIALATVAGILSGNLLYEWAHRRWFHWRPDSCA